MIKKELHLGSDLERMQVTESLGSHLSLDRICNQYFLVDNVNDQDKKFVPNIIEQELLHPPTDINVIRERQKLVSIFANNIKALNYVEKITNGIKWAFDKLNERNLYHALGGLNLEVHRAVNFDRTLSQIIKTFKKNSIFSGITNCVNKIQQETQLHKIVDEWDKVRDAGVSITADLDDRSMKYKLTDGKEITTDRIEAVDLVAQIDKPFQKRLDPLLEVLNPFMEELYDVLGFYVTLAKYGLGLQKNGFPQTMPEITDKPGYLTANNFLNPLLGLENSPKIPAFTDDMDKHDYVETNKNIHIVLGRNKGSKSTYITGRGVLQLQAQMGSPVPSSYCSIGPVPSMGSVFITQVDIGAGQSTFSKTLNGFAEVLDICGENGLVILDDATEGTDPQNANDYMNFMLNKIHSRKMFAWMSTQHKNLYKDNIVPASFYTTVPNKFNIQMLDGIQQPESVHWKDIAKKTTLNNHLD